jgi:hypothetical protein
LILIDNKFGTLFGIRRCDWRKITVKWVEIITLRSTGNINKELVDELVKSVDVYDAANDTPSHLVEINIYHHSVVETDLSVYIHWESEKECQRKSSLGLRFASALKPLGLLNHSVWVEIAARAFAADTSRTVNRGISR